MEKFITEPARKTPVAEEVDVLVLGAGPAGVGAALAAARNGAKTMIVEQYNCAGGMATAGMMSHWSGSTCSPILREIMERAGKCQAGNIPSDQKYETFTINHEQQKTAMYQLLKEAER